MEVLYQRKKHLDRIVRCYLTFKCNGGCEYCSAGIYRIEGHRRSLYINPEIWAEGLNRRKRYTILAGGEPFMYPFFTELISLLDSDYKIEIYSNLKCEVDGFIKAAKKSFSFLVSLHDCDFEVWHKNVEKLLAAGHGVRVHIVKSGNWQARRQFLEDKGYNGRINITGCDDQRVGVKSQGIETNKENPEVVCTTQAYFFGADGDRYPCVTKMGKGVNKLENISDEDGEDFQINECNLFGLCVGCDNNIGGFVRKGKLC